MHQHAGLTVTNTRGYQVGTKGGCQGHVAAGNRLAQTKNIRAHIRMLQREQFAGTAKAGGDFIKDQQHPVLVTQGTHRLQVGGVIHPHAAGALYHRLQNHGGNLLMMIRQHLLDGIEIIGIKITVIRALRRLGEIMFGQHPAEQRMHAIDRVAGSHGPERIAVIAVAQGQQFILAGMPLAEPVLQGHLDRHFHRH